MTQYPWRRPVAQPYAGIVLALSGPLGLMLLLQLAFGLPAGSCVERPLNYVPLLLSLTVILLGIVLAIRHRVARRFTIALTVGLFPITALWGLVATMSLAGCWI